jgi:signal transduction histidine kinase
VIEYSHRLEQKSRELEAATKELKEANERLKELDRMKDEFVSVVSHELRTPLTAIRALSEILHDNPDMASQERQKFLANVVTETERLTRLTNQVLDIAKIESGRADWMMERVDVHEVIEAALSATSQLFLENSVSLIKELPVRGVHVVADRDRLMQVVINLLSNAVKFCEPKTGRVDIRLFSSDGEAHIEVSDNGPGIPTDEQERIFDKFHQIRDKYAGKPVGSGLGLAICQRIVENLGGRIWVVSDGGEGATFTFTLPLAGDEIQKSSSPTPA